MKIKDPMVELLAIKLYEHDGQDGNYPTKNTATSWMKLPDEDRKIYRDIAAGNDDLPDNES